MNDERLIALYDRISDAPASASRLRKFVFDLAVRGKLVEQNPAEDPASELLKHIEREQSDRIARGEMRRDQPSHKIQNAPFALPPGWQWVSVSSTGKIFNGNSINAATRNQLEKANKGRSFIATKDVGYGFEEIDYENGLLVDAGEKKLKTLRPLSPLICMEGGSAGKKIGLTDREVCFGNKLLANETWSVISPEFVMCVYLSSFFYAQFAEKMSGAIGGISLKNFLKLPFPLAPLSEQKRIVAKVNEFNAIYDQLEKKQLIIKSTRDRLSTATLARLTTSDTSKKEFYDHACFTFDNFRSFTTSQDQINSLRNTILNLAMRGKLLGKKHATECSLPQIRDTSETIDGRHHAADADMTLVDFNIPSHWTWKSLDEIATQGPQNGLSPRASDSNRSPKAITLTATTSGRLHLNHFKHVDISSEVANSYWLEPGDLLFQRGNTREYVGMAAVYDGPTQEYLFPDLIIRVKVSKNISIKYAHLWCISPFSRLYFKSNASGSQKSMPKINQKILRALPIGIPPSSEQERIVAKVEELMTLCDRLETSLQRANEKRANLLGALISEELEPISEKQDAA